MNILFLTLSYRLDNIQEKGIYPDLIRQFRNNDHKVYVVSPIERKFKRKTHLLENGGITNLKVKTLNIRKTNLIEKGISTVTIEPLFLKAIKKYYSKIKFDIILYSTPPISFTKVVNYIKKRDSAFSYLLLKDIFPQNAVDLGFIKKGGITHSYFRKKEVRLYQASDKIGCMSPANKEFLLKYNSYLDVRSVEVNPNSIELIEDQNYFISGEKKHEIRKRLNISLESTVFIYGGNLGKPQGLDFLLEILNKYKSRKDCYFLIVGDGTEYQKIKNWLIRNQPKNISLIKSLPVDEYNEILQMADVGMIFLDRRFRIPNFPSRLLSYMEFGKPVIACTDINTDIGDIIRKGRFGFWCENGRIKEFDKIMEKILKKGIIAQLGENSNIYLRENYNVNDSYKKILQAFNTYRSL